MVVIIPYMDPMGMGNILPAAADSRESECGTSQEINWLCAIYNWGAIYGYVGQNGRPLRGPQMWMSSFVLTIHNFGVPNFDPYPYGYVILPTE